MLQDGNLGYFNVADLASIPFKRESVSKGVCCLTIIVKSENKFTLFARRGWVTSKKRPSKNTPTVPRCVEIITGSTISIHKLDKNVNFFARKFIGLTQFAGRGGLLKIYSRSCNYLYIQHRFGFPTEPDFYATYLTWDGFYKQFSIPAKLKRVL